MYYTNYLFNIYFSSSSQGNRDGLHCHPSRSIQVFSEINSQDPVYLPVYLTKRLLLLFTFKFPLLSLSSLFLLLLTTGVQPTSPSFEYFIPIYPFLISTATELQYSSSLFPYTSSYSPSSPALLSDLPSMGAAFRVTMHSCAPIVYLV